MTSLFEGFPLIMMEAMSYGVVPVTTDVGGICDHITSGYNGLLIHESEEAKIVEEGIKKVEQLCEDRLLLKNISQNAINYAYANFNTASFEKNYRAVLFDE